MNAYLERAMELEDEIIRNRRHIHKYPELGMELPKTVRFVCEKLRSYGYKPELIGGGVTCTVGNPGKVILLRGDMDALPMQEESGVEYASVNDGVCHSCGHDTHTAMLLAAAKMLKEREHELAGTVKFMFQPGEEVIEGAKSMIDAGILDNPKVDAALALHIQFGNTLYTDADTGEDVARSPGVITYVPGYATQSGDQFLVTVTGEASQSSEPYKGVSAITAAAHMVTAIEQLVSMEVNCQEQAVVAVCKICGGTAANILCSEVTLEGTIRTFDNDLRIQLLNRFEEICRNTAKTFRADVKVEIVKAVPCVYNDPAFSEEMSGYMREICPEIHRVLRTPGGEDFAWVSHMTGKGLLANLGVGSAKEGYIYPGHHPKMTIDESALKLGAAIYAHCADSWLRSHRQDPPHSDGDT